VIILRYVMLLTFLVPVNAFRNVLMNFHFVAISWISQEVRNGSTKGRMTYYQPPSFITNDEILLLFYNYCQVHCPLGFFAAFPWPAILKLNRAGAFCEGLEYEDFFPCCSHHTGLRFNELVRKLV